MGGASGEDGVSREFILQTPNICVFAASEEEGSGVGWRRGGWGAEQSRGVLLSVC